MNSLQATALLLTTALVMTSCMCNINDEHEPDAAVDESSQYSATFIPGYAIGEPETPLGSPDGEEEEFEEELPPRVEAEDILVHTEGKAFERSLISLAGISLEATIENTGTLGVVVEPRYSLEYYKDGAWQPFPFIEGRNWPDETVDLPPGREIGFSYLFTDLAQPWQNGHYRIVHRMHRADRSGTPLTVHTRFEVR